jgi:hypothetical protein
LAKKTAIRHIEDFKQQFSEKEVSYISENMVTSFITPHISDRELYKE